MHCVFGTWWRERLGASVSYRLWSWRGPPPWHHLQVCVTSVAVWPLRGVGFGPSVAFSIHIMEGTSITCRPQNGEVVCSVRSMLKFVATGVWEGALHLPAHHQRRRLDQTLGQGHTHQTPQACIRVQPVTLMVSKRESQTLGALPFSVLVMTGCVDFCSSVAAPGGGHQIVRWSTYQIHVPPGVRLGLESHQVTKHIASVQAIVLAFTTCETTRGERHKGMNGMDGRQACMWLP